MAVVEAANSEPAGLRVLTWNVWFGAHMFEERCAALLAELHRRQPDVIALQEVTEPLLAMLVDSTWVRARYQLSDDALLQRYDVALLSRVPVTAFDSVELPSTMGRRLRVAELANGLAVATVHLESMKESSQARAEQLAIIQPHLASRYPDAVLVGDMNFKPDDALETATLDASFVDVWPALRPDDPGYTADTVVNTMRYQLKPSHSRKRIDRVFLRSARWQASAIDLVGTAAFDIDGTFVSDHFGLEVTLTARP